MNNPSAEYNNENTININANNLIVKEKILPLNETCSSCLSGSMIDDLDNF